MRKCMRVTIAVRVRGSTGSSASGIPCRRRPDGCEADEGAPYRPCQKWKNFFDYTLWTGSGRNLGRL
jgi:hypothetical protein